MTWRDLLEHIRDMPERFLDTGVQLFDANNGRTYFESMFSYDDTQDDFTIDIDQPQIWFNTEEVE